MARHSGIDRLDASAREELDAKLRGGVSIAAATAWLVDSGFTITARQVQLYSEREKARIAEAKSIAEVNIQAHKIAKAEGIETYGIHTDLLTLSQSYLQQAMTTAGPKYFESLRPIDMLNASSRLMAVEVQVQRLKEDLKAKATIEMKAIEGELDLTNDMLIQIRQRIYGIFD